MSSKNSQLHSEIIEDIKKLYNMNFSDSFRHYSKDVRYVDPLTDCYGLEKMKTAFFALPKIFSSTEILKFEPNSVTDSQINIDLSTKYTFKYLNKSKVINSNVLLKLKENEIIYQEETWDNKMNIDHKVSPVIGRIKEWIRIGNANIFYFLLRKK